MDEIKKFKEQLVDVTNDNFTQYALELFQFQSRNNPTYKTYIDYLGLSPDNIQDIRNIPFLPIEFFKHHTVQSGQWSSKLVFRSSGTTKTGRSQHFIEDPSFYLQVAWHHGLQYIEDLEQKQILALLPSYLETGDSSLVYMVESFVQKAQPGSQFVRDPRIMAQLIQADSKPKVVFGVTYALLELASYCSLDHYDHLTIIETGGMKGRKKEITRMELHQELSKIFRGATLLSEYGMTELMSQAYGMSGLLKFPTWCRSLIRDVNDPFAITTSGKGGLNIIDLANIHSCAFLETKDLADVKKSGEFLISGRMDNADIRGCSLLM